MDTNNNAWQDQEYKGLMKILNFRLPHKFKRIGVLGAFLLLGFIIYHKQYGANDILVKEITRTLILLFLLISALSKDFVEDEYIDHIRYQSHVIAFVCAIGYAILLPLIALLMDILVTNIQGDGEVSFHEISAFEVMFMLVCFQILFFEVLKRFGRA